MYSSRLDELRGHHMKELILLRGFCGEGRGEHLRESMRDRKSNQGAGKAAKVRQMVTNVVDRVL